jgi:hypothetical protein
LYADKLLKVHETFEGFPEHGANMLPILPVESQWDIDYQLLQSAANMT